MKNTYAGFSLVEVLVSLLLVTSTSLAVLKQQLHLSHLLHQTAQQTQGLIAQDNSSERRQWESK